NETAAYAHVFFPGTSFLEKEGTFTNAERRINRVRPVMAERNGMAEWEVVCRLARAMGYDMRYESAAEIMDEIARLTPPLAGVSGEERHGRVGGGLPRGARHGLRNALRFRGREHGLDGASVADLRRRELRAPRRGGLAAMACQLQCAGRHADHAYRQVRARQ